MITNILDTTPPKALRYSLGKNGPDPGTLRHSGGGRGLVG